MSDQGEYRPGWYPDPTGRYELRYHNGRIWTGDISVDGRRFVDPLPEVPSGPYAAGFAGGATSPTVPQERIGAPIAAFVLAICSVALGWVPFICFLTAVGAVVALILAVPGLRRDRERRQAGIPVSRGRSYCVAAIVLAPIGLAVTVIGVWLTVVTVREVDEFQNVGPRHTEITTCGVADGAARAEGILQNLSATRRSYQITLVFRRAGARTILATKKVDVDDVEGGATVSWTALRRVTADAVDCEISNVTGPAPFGLDVDG